MVDKYSVGIGIISAGRREPRNLREDPNSEVFRFIDTERKGPAYARNQVLKHFKDKDYIFLLDDDVSITMHGWEDYFISQAVQHQIHYMALPEGFKSKRYSYSEGEIDYWDGALGCFSFRDQKCLQTVGGYNQAYDGYAFEDIAFNHRCDRAKLTGHMHGFAFPVRGLMYVHSEDIYAENPTPNLSHEEKMFYIEKHRKTYEEEINSENLYYPI